MPSTEKSASSIHSSVGRVKCWSRALGDSANWWCGGSIAYWAEAWRKNWRHTFAGCHTYLLILKCSKSHVWKDSRCNWQLTCVSIFTDLSAHLLISVYIYRYVYTFTDRCTHLQICSHICRHVHTSTDRCTYLSTFAFTSVIAFTILNTHLQIFVHICKSYYSLMHWNTDSQLFTHICK